MLELRTGCRLHFGLLELAADYPNRFGGLGLMIATPQVRVAIVQSEQWPECRRFSDEVERRVGLAVDFAQAQLGASLPDGWTAVVLEIPALHSGLGLGTQLAASVATAVEVALSLAAGQRLDDEVSAAHWSAELESGSEWRSVEAPTPHLAYVSGRGKRSAIGLHGFLHGGLIQDLGYLSESASSPALHTHCPVPDSEAIAHRAASPPAAPRSVAVQATGFPDDWPIVLILGSEGSCMHGKLEETLITAAGARPNPHRDEMIALSKICMSAARQRNFDEFVLALENYMTLASRLFESVQSGRYSNAEIANTVARATELGLRGVGQSSWGPTVFGFANHVDKATTAAQGLRQILDPGSSQVVIASASEHGAQWRINTTGAPHAS